MARGPIVLGLSEGRSRPLTAARLVNLFAEPAPVTSRAPVAREGLSSVRAVLFGTPGLKAFATVGTGRIRAGKEALGYAYVLSGAELYRVEEDGTATLCTGDTLPSDGDAMMTDNGQHLTLLVNRRAFKVVETAIVEITSPAYPASGVSSIDTIDGYTLFSTAPDAEPVYGSPISISGATQASPCVITAAAHGLANGARVLIVGVTGMTDLNDNTYAVQNVATDTLELVGVDSSAFGVYVSGGSLREVRASAGGQWFISALYDSASLDPLDFASAESNPDELRRLIVSNRDVLLFGAKTIEPWQNTGRSPFPFERVSGGIIEKGTVAPLSPAIADTTVAWLGDDGMVYKAEGYRPVRISTFAVEEILRTASMLSDAVGMTYSQGGHTFYVLTLPTAMRTLVYDFATGFWHERQSGTSTEPDAWGVRCIFTAFGKTLAGCDSGAVAELDMDTYADLGSTIRRVAVSAPIYPEGKRARMPELEIECELGVGLATGQGSDPHVMLRLSRDGGSTWSNERRAPLGPTGVRRKRARFLRNGQFRELTAELAISDPVKVAIYGARYEVGA